MIKMDSILQRQKKKAEKQLRENPELDGVIFLHPYNIFHRVEVRLK